MKNNIKTSIIGCTIAAMLAFCGTVQAQTVTFPVSNWGTTSLDVSGWSITEGSPGNFSIGSGQLQGSAAWGAMFPTTTLVPGQYIELTGSFDITGYVAPDAPLHFGLFNEDGNMGTLSSGVWTGGSPNWTGYLFAPPTGASGFTGGSAGEFTGHVNQTYASTYSAYGFGTPDAFTTGTTNGIGNDTFTFEIKLEQLSSSAVRMTTSLIGSTNAILYSVGPSVNTDSGGGATANTTYDAVGFYLASTGGTATTQIDFHNVQITVAPEPASIALLTGGLVGLWLLRRSRK